MVLSSTATMPVARRPRSLLHNVMAAFASRASEWRCRRIPPRTVPPAVADAPMTASATSFA